MNQPPVVETATPGAPHEIDVALRERAMKFYQAHVDGKFRQADAYVAEESKDYFFGMPKTQYLKVWGHKIKYSDNFQKADVITTVDMELSMPRIGTMKVRPQIPSTWKIEDGKWVWYKNPEQGIATPMGVGKASPDGRSGGALNSPMIGVSDVLGGVKADKEQVKLLSYKESQDVLKITNTLPGEVRISVEGISAPGLEIKVDKTRLVNKESAEIVFRYSPPNPSPKPTLNGFVRVDPLNLRLPLQAIFDIPEDVKAKLPKIQ
jgi:hypothetical protein